MTCRFVRIVSASRLRSCATRRPREAWDELRTLCEHAPALVVALELTPDLPSEAALARWAAEPVKAVIVPTCAPRPAVASRPILGGAHHIPMTVTRPRRRAHLLSKGSSRVAPGGGGV